MAESMLGTPESPSEAATPATETQQAAAPVAPTTEAASAETKSEPAAEKPAEQAKPAGAPEKYEFKAAEGESFDQTVIDAYSEVAKELNLTQEAAQKVLDRVAPAIAKSTASQVQALQSQWVETSKADKEFGGEKLTENLAIAVKARDRFGTPELRKLLNESGLGNHPEIIRAFYRAGKAIAEDGFVPGAASRTPEADPAKRLFPNMA